MVFFERAMASVARARIPTCRDGGRTGAGHGGDR
jgi:hypothetical protein